MNRLIAFLVLFLGLTLKSAAVTTLSINNLPYSLQVGDTLLVFASGGTAPYTWTSSNPGAITVTQFDSITARIIVLSSMPNVTIHIDDILSDTGNQIVHVFDYKTRIGNASFFTGDTVLVPIYYSNKVNSVGLLSADISLPYDTTLFKFIGFNKIGTLSSPMTVISNQVFDTIKFGVAAIVPIGITEEQVFLMIRFVSKTTVITSQSSPLHFTKFLVNESISGAFVNGMLTVDPIPNFPPVFVNVASNATINEGDNYLFTFLATDANGHAVHYFLTMNPAPGVEASIDSITGQFIFTPSYTSANIYVFEVTANDGNGMTTQYQFTLTVNNVNRPPAFSSIFADTIYVLENQNFLFYMTATDADGDFLHYYAFSPLPGMTVDSISGLIQWTPNFNQAGVYNTTFKVKDPFGAYDSRYVVFIVVNLNQAPSFTTVLPDTTVAENQFLTFNYKATDPDLDSLLFILIKPVVGMSVMPKGLLQWQPSYTQAGIETVIVLVHDGFGGVALDTAIITVTNVNNPPMFTVTMNDTVVARFDTLRFHYSGTDPDSQSVNFSLQTNPVGATMSLAGDFVWSPPLAANGMYNFIIQLTDGFSIVNDTVQVKVIRFGDVSGNGTITSFDAGMILRHLVSAITLNAVQVRIGDVDRDTAISPMDASLILQYAVGLINTFPGGLGKFSQRTAILSAFSFKIVPSQSMGDYDLFVSVNKPSQVYGMTMSLRFDSSIIVPKNMKQTELTDSMAMSYFFPKGKANLALAGIKPLNTIGDIAKFTFTLKNPAIATDAVLFTMDKFVLNEKDFTKDVGGITLSVNNAAAVPTDYALQQNFPNPFNPATTINYQLPKNSKVSVSIYNLLGQLVITLINNEQSAGYYSIKWNGSDAFNRTVSSGVYIYKIIAESQDKKLFSDTKKMLLIK